MAIALIILGLLIMTVGGLMQLVAAFRQSIGWGVACLVLPMASMVFVMIHWAQAKAGFLTGLVGAAFAITGILTCDSLPAGKSASLGGKSPFALILPGKSQPSTPPKDINARVQEKRDRIEQLENEFGQAGVALVAQFQALNAERNKLKQDDPVAVAKFNAANAAYQTQNAAQKQRQQEIATLQKGLENLLDERSKTQPHPAVPVSYPSAPAARPAARPVNASNKQVIMYSTSSCPACRAAKEYFARKGVHYQEYDVNSNSSAREEFQRLGGRGVPLILVGNDKVEGFSAQRLDQLL